MRRLYVLSAVLLLNSIASSFLYAAPSAAVPEIHLVVDVSGSMKKTDPQNLRAKSINMFIYLMKNKAQMNMDVFSTDVQNIIPSRLVDNNFERLFAKRRGAITSAGALTNIELALTHADESWKNNNDKIIVLLTDGKIDLGSDTNSTDSKNRVINQTIKTLAEHKVRVFTVGFSEGADKDLLNQIAIGTDGIPQIINSSNDIDNTLYKIFTAVIPINGAPIKKYKYKSTTIGINQNTTRLIDVDKNIQHLTLIFKKNAGIAEVYLTTPDGKKSSINELSPTKEESLNYKFVDIDKPQIGRWLLSGPEQDIERAIILTNVKLLSSFSSGVYFEQERILIVNHLEDNDQIITEPIVIDSLRMKFKMITGRDQYSYTIPYTDNGEFRSNVSFNSPAGKYSVTLSAKSNYLSRELQFIVDLQPSPFKQTVNPNSTVDLELLHPDLIKAESVQIKVVSDNKPVDVPVEKTGWIWKFDFSALCNLSTPNQISLLIASKKNNDKEVEFRFIVAGASVCPMLVSQIEPAPEDHTSVIEAVKIKHHKSTAAATAVKPQPSEIAKEQSKFNYKILVYAISILVLLVVVFGLAILGWLAYAKKIKDIKNELKNELSEDVLVEAKDEPKEELKDEPNSENKNE